MRVTTMTQMLTQADISGELRDDEIFVTYVEISYLDGGGWHSFWRAMDLDEATLREWFPEWDGTYGDLVSEFFTFTDPTNDYFKVEIWGDRGEHETAYCPDLWPVGYRPGSFPDPVEDATS